MVPKLKNHTPFWVTDCENYPFWHHFIQGYSFSHLRQFRYPNWVIWGTQPARKKYPFTQISICTCLRVPPPPSPPPLPPNQNGIHFCQKQTFNTCSSCAYWISFEQKLFIWATSSEFVSSSIPSWQILTAHAQPFRGARALAFCLKVPLDSLLVWASSEGSGETSRMRRLAWTFAARIGDKYQIRLARPIW